MKTFACEYSNLKSYLARKRLFIIMTHNLNSRVHIQQSYYCVRLFNKNLIHADTRIKHMSSTPLPFAQRILSAVTAQASVNLEENVVVTVPATNALKIDGIVSSAPVYEATWINAVRVGLPSSATETSTLGVNYYETLAGDAASIVDEGTVAIRVSDSATVANVKAGTPIFFELGTGRACLSTDTGASTVRVGTAMSDVRAGLGYIDRANSGQGDTNAEGMIGLYPFSGDMANRSKGDVVKFYVLVKLSIELPA